jgi:hypothetical protein
MKHIILVLAIACAGAAFLNLRRADLGIFRDTLGSSGVYGGWRAMSQAAVLCSGRGCFISGLADGNTCGGIFE